MAAAASSHENGEGDSESKYYDVDDTLSNDSSNSAWTSWFRDNSPVNKIIFRPPKPSYSMDSSDDVARCVHWVRLNPDNPRDGMIPVLIRSYSTCAKHIVFYMHGNAEDLGDVYERVLLLSSWMNAHVCAVEYPGYGPMKGQCNQTRAFEFARRVVEDIVSNSEVTFENVVLFGRSIGSGVAMSLAEHFGDRFGGFVLQSPLMSVAHVASAQGSFWSFLNTAFGGGQQFRSVDYMKNVTAPTLIVHGRNDKVIPLSHGEALYKACPVPDDKKELIIDERANHFVFNKELMETSLGAFMCDVTGTCRAFSIRRRSFSRLDDVEKMVVSRHTREIRPGELRQRGRDLWIL